MTMIARKWLACAAIAGSLLTATAAPGFAATLKMAWAQDATGLDPHKQTAFSSIRLLELIYEPLVRLDGDLKVVPALAKEPSSWSPSVLTEKLVVQYGECSEFAC